MKKKIYLSTYEETNLTALSMCEGLMRDMLVIIFEEFVVSSEEM